MNSGWETAIAYLKLAMETAFETIATASLALEIKDFVLLSCSALGEMKATSTSYFAQGV